MLNMFFNCSQSRLRSPTAEQVFANWPGVTTASAGINQGADTPLSAELLDWADLVFVMEPVHRRKIAAKFRTHLRGTRLICLGIPDGDECMDPGLIKVLEQRVVSYLPQNL